MRLFCLLMIAWVSLSACGTLPTPAREPQRIINAGERLYTETFDRGSDWREYDQEGVTLKITDGVYRGQLAGGVYVWGINNRAHDDVILETDATLTSDGDKNGFGLVCRADPSNDGDGYYFLVGGDGSVSIRRGRMDAVEALVAWERSASVRAGIRTNEIRAVCAGDYLALYVNGDLVAETTDSLYQRGYAGVALVSLEDEPVVVDFDNFSAWQAVEGR